MWPGSDTWGAVGSSVGCPLIPSEACLMGLLVSEGWIRAAEECEKFGLTGLAKYFRKMAAENAFIPQSVLWP